MGGKQKIIQTLYTSGTYRDCYQWRLLINILRCMSFDSWNGLIKFGLRSWMSLDDIIAYTSHLNAPKLRAIKQEWLCSFCDSMRALTRYVLHSSMVFCREGPKACSCKLQGTKHLWHLFNSVVALTSQTVSLPYWQEKVQSVWQLEFKQLTSKTVLSIGRQLLCPEIQNGSSKSF